MVIEACLCIIHIDQFRDIINFLTRHFQDGNIHSNIIGSPQPSLSIIPQILLLDQIEEFCIERSKMTDPKVDIPKDIFLTNFRSILPWIANISCSFDEIWKDNPWISFLVHCVIDFEDLFAQQIVIPIYDYEYFIRFTKLFCRIIDIGKSHLSFLIYLYSHPIWWLSIFTIDVFLEILSCLIFRAVINCNNPIIAIILHEDRVYVSYIPVVFNIVVGWDNDTKW